MSRQAAPITAMVLILSGTWYLLSAHKHYKGPMARKPIVMDNVVEDTTPTDTAKVSPEDIKV